MGCNHRNFTITDVYETYVDRPGVKGTWKDPDMVPDIEGDETAGDLVRTFLTCTKCGAQRYTYDEHGELAEDVSEPEHRRNT